MHGWLVAVKPLQSNLLYCKQRFQFWMLYIHYAIYALMTEMQLRWKMVGRRHWTSEWSDNDFRTSTLLMHVVGSFTKTAFSWHILICRIHIKNYMSQTQNSILVSVSATLVISHCALCRAERERCGAVNSVNKLSILQWILIKNQKLFCAANFLSFHSIH